MKRILAAFAVLCALGFAPGHAVAQSGSLQVLSSCGTANYPATQLRSGTQDTTGKTCVNATVSASIAALAPTGQAALTAGTTTSRVALGSVGPTALVTNNGTVTAFINFGGSGVTAATTGYPVNAGQSVAFNVGSNTFIAGITGSSTAALAITTGTGLPAIAGGGTGGGGSSGAVFGPTAVGSAVANPPVVNGFQDGSGNVAVVTPSVGLPVNIVSGSASSSTFGATFPTTGLAIGAKNGSVMDVLTTDTSHNLNVNVAAGTITATFTGALPAGTNLIGKVGIDQTTPGTTNGVQSLAGSVANTTAQGAQNYANAANFIGGTASTTAGTATTLVAASGAGLKSYITDLACYNTSATTITIALNDSLSSVFIVPAGGGFVLPAQTPLITAANTALTFTASAAETTIGCTGRGYKAS